MRKKQHQEFPEYLVRSDGFVERRVDSCRYQKAGDILKGRILESGYRQFKLCHADGRITDAEGRPILEQIHQLMIHLGSMAEQVKAETVKRGSEDE